MFSASLTDHPTKSLQEIKTNFLYQISTNRTPIKSDTLDDLKQHEDEQYARVKNAVEAGATLTNIQDALLTGNQLHPVIKRLVSDTELQHTNIQIFRKEYYLRALHYSQSNHYARMTDSIAFENALYTLISAAAFNGAQMQELTNAIGPYSQHLFTKLIEDETHQYANINTIRRAYYLFKIIETGDKLFKLIQAQSCQFFNAGAAALSSDESVLANFIFQYYKAGGDINSILDGGDQPIIPIGTALRLKSRIQAEMEQEKILEKIVPLTKKLAQLDEASKMDLAGYVVDYMKIKGKLERVFDSEACHVLSQLAAEKLAGQKDILHLHGRVS